MKLRDVTRTPELGALLRRLRNEQNRTIDWVAKQVGVSRQQVMRWESGENRPQAQNELALEDAYGLSAGLIAQLALAEIQLDEVRALVGRLPELEEMLVGLRESVRVGRVPAE